MSSQAPAEPRRAFLLQLHPEQLRCLVRLLAVAAAREQFTRLADDKKVSQ
jgi:hypothetical protein